ncbi:PAS domain-containing protein [Sphingomonas sp. MMS24-JH45]
MMAASFVAFIARPQRYRSRHGRAGGGEGYRVLLDIIEEGFCIAEQLPGEPPDFRYVAANPAFQRHDGSGGPGRPHHARLVPSVEAAPMQLYGRVVATGRTEALETDVPDMDRWFEVEATAMDQPGQVAVLFRHITPRKRAERAAPTARSVRRC